MFHTIVKALENFCIHQIRLPYTINNNILDMRTLIAYIDIQTHDEKKFRVYIAIQKDFAQRISKIFLEEDESDEETLIDMTLETANLIIGSAKVIAEDENKSPFTIGTPHFKEMGTFDIKCSDTISLEVQNDKMMICMKEL
jgi:chemotaxis protein CheY-P-specific phosphatase CheC